MKEEENKLEQDVKEAFAGFDFPEYNEATNTYTIRDNNFVAIINADVFCKAMQDAAKNYKYDEKN